LAWNELALLHAQYFEGLLFYTEYICSEVASAYTKNAQKPTWNILSMQKVNLAITIYVLKLL